MTAMPDHAHHRSGDASLPKRVGNWVVWIGGVCFGLTCIGAVLWAVWAYEDKKVITPFVQERTAPIMQKHQTWDSMEHVRLEKKMDSEHEWRDVEFRLLLKNQTAMMTPAQKEKAMDAIVNDTTIPKSKIGTLLR